jgi:phosphoenolpyruvate synthase/pyruvate phosphate dikinase
MGMKAGKNLILLKGREDLNAIGMKAANLLRLKQMGFRVPVTYVIPWHVQARQKEGHGQDLSSLKGDVLRIVEAHKSYAVRSSANVEDQFEKSYAGQFQSLLDVRGPEAIMEAITSVWESLDSSEAREYSKGQGLSETGLRMSVILQEMVEPVISGVAFNRNPLTGIRETVVEAVRGPGTALLQEGVTPYRWIYHNGEFTSCPESTDMPLSVLEKVVEETRAIARKARIDVDLEWVWDGHQVMWVQMRRITTLSQVKLYSNRISKEMQPGLVKPLIWSVNIPLVNGVWIDMLTEVIGANR